MEPTCNFLPPNMQGYQKLDPCPYGDPNGEPNIAKAKQLIQQAGATGAKVTVWGNDEDETRQVTVALADQLKAIGLDARPRVVEGSVYFQTIGNQKTKAQAGFANWFQDFPHPANFMFLIDGASIQETNNQNFGNVDDPTINATLAKINQNADLKAVAPQYAECRQAPDGRGPRRAVRQPQAHADHVGPARVRPDRVAAQLQRRLHDIRAEAVDDLDRFPELDGPASGTAAEGESPWRLAWRRLRRNRLAIFFAALFVVLVVMALCAPLYAEHVAHTTLDRNNITGKVTVGGEQKDVVSLDGIPIGPTWQGEYLLGADQNGRDVAVRLLYGARNSMFIALTATAITTILGIILGLLAGYYRGWVDWIISRSMDVLWAVPVLLLGVAFLGVCWRSAA